MLVPSYLTGTFIGTFLGVILNTDWGIRASGVFVLATFMLARVGIPQPWDWTAGTVQHNAYRAGVEVCQAVERDLHRAAEDHPDNVIVGIAAKSLSSACPQ
jgi:hypothetical protein